MGAQPGHTGHKRPLAELSDDDIVIECKPQSYCSACHHSIKVNERHSRRHQVFDLPKVSLEITEYQIFHGHCQYCNATYKGELPETSSKGQIGSRLMGHIAILAGKYHLSVSQTRQLLLDQYGVTFSTGAISEAQGKVSAMLTPTHQSLKEHIHKALYVHCDETSHSRNDEQGTRWCWLISSEDAVFQTVRYSRGKESAKFVLGDCKDNIVITDNYAAYNFINPEKHQLCLAHVQRNLQQMADYSGGGLTSLIGKKLVLILKTVFRTQHRREQSILSETLWLRRMQRLKRSFTTLLEKGAKTPSDRYSGRCQHLLKHETGLWVFVTHKGTPLTNNEAERCIRGTVIMRKNCFGTSSDRGDKFRSRVLSVIETCKKRGLSALEVISEIVTAVTQRKPYPDVFNLTSD